MVERSLSPYLLLALAGASALFTYTESSFIRYLLAALSAYASLSIALERVVPRALAECFLGIERDLLVVGEPFKISLTLTSWLSPIVGILRVELLGSEGVSVVDLKTSRGGVSLRVDIIASARVGLHEISEVHVVARLKTFTASLRFVVKVGTSLRAVPRVDAAVVSRRAGVPYDVGLSLTGIAGPGTQFYGNREYRPGDELRRVDWKASSRTGRLVVKVFEKEVYRMVVLIVPISERYFRKNSEALDALAGELLKVVAELVRRGTEVLVSVVSSQHPPLPAFVKIRKIDDVANLAEYFSYVNWSRRSRSGYSVYRSALWTSVKLLSEVVPGRSVVVYLGEPESDVDVVAGKIVASALKNLGHEPVFAVVSPEIVRIALGEPSTEDLAELARFSRIPISELRAFARVTYFHGENFLEFLARSLTA